MRKATTRGLVLVLLLLVFPACFKIGNDLAGTCERGDECVCDLIGNCSRSCPEGGCLFECRGTSNCLFSCEGGGCRTICENTGNCITECASGGCSADCEGNIGNCIVNEARDLSMPAVDQRTPVDLAQQD